MKNTMKYPPLPINVTLNQDGDGAILHINCQSDGKKERWPEDKEEGSTQAKDLWLGKLGCLLKWHGDIECQWPHLSVEADTDVPSYPDKFNDPWAYRISTFPINYKLFAVARPAQGEDPPRKDHYLLGKSSFFLVCATSLTALFRWAPQVQISTGVLSPPTMVV